MTKEEIKKDFLAFADDDSEIVFDINSGDLLYYKNDTEHLCRILTNSDCNTIIEYQGENFPYRPFIAKNLARLHLFARKITEKRKGVEAFVDTPAVLKTVYSE